MVHIESYEPYVLIQFFTITFALITEYWTPGFQENICVKKSLIYLSFTNAVLLYKKRICSSLFLLCTSWTWSQICWGLRLWRPWGRRVRGPELTSWEDHINRWVWNRTMSQNPGTCCSKQRHERQDISGFYAVQTRPCTDIFGPRKPDYKQTLWCCHGDSLFPLSDGTYWPIVHLVYGIESLLLPPERRNPPSAFAAGFPALRSLGAPSPSRSLSISCPASYPLTDWLISWWEQREREREKWRML